MGVCSFRLCGGLPAADAVANRVFVFQCVCCRGLPAAETKRNGFSAGHASRSRLIEYMSFWDKSDLRCFAFETEENLPKGHFPVDFSALAAFPPSERGFLVRRLLSFMVRIRQVWNKR